MTAPTLAQLTDLRDRVRAATAPDRELDAVLQYHYPGKVLPYTASLDFALVLVERVLPGWGIGGLRQDDRRKWSAELRRGYQTSYDLVAIEPFGLPGTTAPLALVAALLSALIAQQEAADGE